MRFSAEKLNLIPLSPTLWLLLLVGCSESVSFRGTSASSIRNLNERNPPSGESSEDNRRTANVESEGLSRGTNQDAAEENGNVEESPDHSSTVSESEVGAPSNERGLYVFDTRYLIFVGSDRADDQGLSAAVSTLLPSHEVQTPHGTLILGNEVLLH